jgi:putative alpha-1,2-mannosidase
MMVRALIDIWRNEGRMPDCRMSFSKGYTQGGSNADVVVADALIKGLTEGIDWDAAWQAVFADAEIGPANWLVEGRGGVGYWRDLGFIPVDAGVAARSVSRSVEYGYDDFCIAQMAKKLNRVKDAEEFLKRSRNWENLFNDETPSAIHANISDPGEDTGFVGFLQPRMSNGTWGYQDPILCSPIYDFHACYFDTRHATYEGSIWLYTFLAAPGDMATLIKRMGGKDLFVKRLEFFHESGLLDIGDEQSFLTVFMYHYAGRPGLSARRVHEYIPSAFNASVNGLPGKLGKRIAICRSNANFPLRQRR